MVNLPVNYAHEVGLQSREQKEEVRKIFVNQLIQIFNDILDNKDDIIRRSKLSFNHVAKNHSLSDYSRKLASIYSTFK